MAANLDYSRIEVAADARCRPMKLYKYTANGAQQSIHPTPPSKIGSPEG